MREVALPGYANVTGNPAVRAVVQVDPKFHPSGKRFLVKQYPKDKQYRRLKLSQQLVRKLGAHIEETGLSPHDVIFTMPPKDHPAARLRAAPHLATLGFTRGARAGLPTGRGRRFRRRRV